VRGPGPLDAADRAAALPLTLGTAGHVDHGKTELVRALTGVDTDRLPQEQARGMSIELGYASLELPSGRRLSVVDVPGHERFIRAMVAGATGIDCYLMAIAADEGVGRQTHEHAQILRSLGVATGVVAITKSDRADPRAAIEQARALLPQAAAVACSARSGSGLAELLAALERATAALAGRGEREGPAVLHIDRSFTVAGIGTVVTGTLWSGTIAVGETLVLHPGKLDVRVRSLEIHGQRRERVAAGQRVAVNLARCPRTAVARGDVLAARGAVAPSYRLDVRLGFEPGPAGRSGWRVQVHHGTRATSARAVALGELGCVQLRCQTPLMARAGERVVIRDGARRDTLGGAVVVDPRPPRHSPEGAPSQTRRWAPRGKVQHSRAAIEGAYAAGVQAAAGAADATGVVDVVAVAGAGGTPDAGHAVDPAPPAPLSPAALALAARLRREGFGPSPDSQLDPAEVAELASLRPAGLVVRLVHGRHAHADAVAAAAERVRGIVAAEGQVTLPGMRDALGVSRRDAKAFLDHFDSTGLTLRRPDDTRILRARGR
jgi:selenocysteine-specific elongation factor